LAIRRMPVSGMSRRRSVSAVRIGRPKRKRAPRAWVPQSLRKSPRPPLPPKLLPANPRQFQKQQSRTRKKLLLPSLSLRQNLRPPRRPRLLLLLRPRPSDTGAVAAADVIIGGLRNVQSLPSPLLLKRDPLHQHHVPPLRNVLRAPWNLSSYPRNCLFLRACVDATAIPA
jgi:hypothetical protein